MGSYTCKELIIKDFGNHYSFNVSLVNYSIGR